MTIKEIRESTTDDLILTLVRIIAKVSYYKQDEKRACRICRELEARGVITTDFCERYVHEMKM